MTKMIIEYISATVANGASLSGAVNLQGYLLCGVIVPSGWDAANITLQASDDNSTFYNVYDVDGTEYTVTTAASYWSMIPPSELPALEYIKVRSGTAGTPVNQTGDATVKLVVRPA